MLFPMQFPIIASVSANAVLSALLLAGLLLIYMVIRMRFESQDAEHAAVRRELENLAALVEALDRSADVQAPPPPPARDDEVVQYDLSALESEVEAVRKGLAAVERQLAGLARTMERDRIRRLHDAIEQRFVAQGYGAVRFLAELDLASGEPAKVPLEAKKGGTTYKGHVVIEDGRVVSEKMSSSYEAFP